jgi:sensor histidine kinase YesM
MNKTKLYWLSQIGVWLFFTIIEMASYASVFGFNRMLLLNGFLNFVLGILLTHAYRFVVLKLKLLQLPTTKLIPKALIFIIIISGMLTLFNIWLDRVTVPNFGKLPFNFALISGYLFNWSKYILLWALIYHLFQYWEKSLQAERDKYRLEASLKEIEYNNLKTQLNPHFLFNSLNGIRTLVDVNPHLAKVAITKLSNLLRSSLHMSNYKTVSLRQEIETVKDYLDIEKLRFEDRLLIEYKITDEAMDAQFPPMMLQTLTENSVKHGIAKLKQGGTIVIEAFVKDKLCVNIENPGTLDMFTIKNPAGYGLKNTRERLKILYGDQAELSITNKNNETVLTQILIPI